MTIRHLVPTVALLAATFSTSPALAQDKGRDRDSKPRAEDNRRRDEGRQAQRRDGGAPRVEQRRDNDRRDNDRRGDNRNRGWQGNDRDRNRGVQRWNNGNRGWDNRYDNKFRGTPRAYAPRFSQRYQINRPYVFKPRRQLSFGLSLGFGVPYAYRYSYPVPIYGYGAPSAPVYITPQSKLYGGVTLEIWPGEADVIVDGQYVGQVYDFDGTEGPLNLRAGRHRLEIDAPGFEPLVTDIDVYPGQLVPFRGELRNYR